MTIRKLLMAGILLAFTFPVMMLGAENTPNNNNTPHYLFVISVKSGTFSGNQLIVKAMPQVIYFSDHPDHIAGHIRMKHFALAWTQEDLQSSPPNATISILNTDDVNNVVIEIQNLEIKNGNVVLTIKTLEGNLPKTFGTASIFIDPFPTCVNDPYGCHSQ